jgi:hypothetical protein
VEPIDRDHFFHEGGRFGLNFLTDQSTSTVALPHWFIALLIITAALVPWIRWQFGLRTSLIVTTLVAVVLGFVAAF